MNDDFTFPGTRRLRASADFTRAWNLGRRVHTAHFIVISCQAKTDEARLGITVSRKVGNAVCRNRLKRWIREFFRHHRVNLAQARDLSIVAKRQAANLSHAEVDRELQQAITRLESGGHV